MMTGLFGETQVLHRQFNYDEFGNPVSVVYLETDDGTGTPTFSFDYDVNHRLTHYRGYSDHNLTYNSSGQIVIDSGYYNYAGGDARYENRLYYDVYGRIRKETSKFYYDYGESEDVGTTTTRIYEYDRRGNLISPGYTYDNKKNIARTHPIWMYITRNYSINNPEKASSYNSSGLPLTYGNIYVNFLESSIQIQTVEYDCGEQAK
jgi:hypothetical protein